MCVGRESRFLEKRPPEPHIAPHTLQEGVRWHFRDDVQPTRPARPHEFGNRRRRRRRRPGRYRWSTAGRAPRSCRPQPVRAALIDQVDDMAGRHRPGAGRTQPLRDRRGHNGSGGRRGPGGAAGRVERGASGTGPARGRWCVGGGVGGGHPFLCIRGTRIRAPSGRPIYGGNAADRQLPPYAFCECTGEPYG